jgi:hypothetical protein
MINEGFDVFVTADQNLQYQQRVESIPIIIVVLKGSDNRRSTLQNLIPLLLEGLNTQNPTRIILIAADEP